MANSIGKAALVLTADAGKLQQGLSQAAETIKQWAGTATAAVSGIIAGISAAAVADSIKSINMEGMTAKGLGISTDTFQEFASTFKRMGLDGEAVADLFSDLGDKIQDGAVHGAEAAEILGDIGLNAKDLMGLSVDKQFLAIADAMAKVEDDSTAAGIAVRLMSDNGLKLLPLLKGGSGEFAKMAAEARELGQVLSPEEMQKASSAGLSLARLGAVTEGIWRKFTVALAPAAEAVSNLLISVAPLFQAIGRGLATAVEILAEFWDIASKTFSGLISDIGTVVQELTGWSATMPSIEDVVTAAFMAVAKAVAYCVEGGHKLRGVFVWAFGGIVDACKSVVGALGGLMQMMSSLPDVVGGSDFKQAADGYRMLQNYIGNYGDKMRKLGSEQMASTSGALQAVDKFFVDLEAKRIAARMRQDKQSVAKMKEAAKEVQAEYKSVGAMLKGSKEAWSVEARFKTNAMQSNTVEKQQLDEAKRGNTILGQVRDAIGRIAQPILGVL